MAVMVPREKFAARSAELRPPRSTDQFVRRGVADQGPKTIVGARVESQPIMAHDVGLALLFGGSHIAIDGDITFFEGVHPPYCVVGTGSDSVPAVEKTQHVDGPVLSTLHWNSVVYGHFLLESLPQIAFFHELDQLFPGIKVAVRAPWPRWIADIIGHFIPHDRIVRVPLDGAVATDRLILVDCLLHRPPLSLHYSLQDIVHQAIDRAPKTDTPELIFLSRKKRREQWGDFRVWENEAEVAQALDGFTVIDPDEVAWLDQVHLFANARCVVGEFSSALHNAIFSRPGTRLVAVNWVNHVQDIIAAAGGHEINYILPEDGAPRLWAPKSPTQAFRVRIEDARAAVFAGR